MCPKQTAAGHVYSPKVAAGWFERADSGRIPDWPVVAVAAVVEAVGVAVAGERERGRPLRWTQQAW